MGVPREKHIVCSPGGQTKEDTRLTHSLTKRFISNIYKVLCELSVGNVLYVHRGKKFVMVEIMILLFTRRRMLAKLKVLPAK